ncbi:hypothetical protein QZH41_018870, partial [Actinostola sp. cb2023]
MPVLMDVFKETKATTGFIADVQGSYKPAFSTAGWIMLLAFLIPFLQYCFKPWRKEVTRRRHGVVALSVVTDTNDGEHEVVVESYINEAVEQDREDLGEELRYERSRSYTIACGTLVMRPRAESYRVVTHLSNRSGQAKIPDSAWSWLVCVVGTLAFTLIVGLPWTYAVLLPVLMDRFKSSMEEL